MAVRDRAPAHENSPVDTGSAAHAALAFIVPVTEHASRDELVGTLAGSPPGAGDPGAPTEYTSLDRCQPLRAVAALVLEQVTQILAGEQSEQSTTMATDPGQLEIDNGRHSALALQPVRFLGEVVVGDTAAANPLEQLMRFTEVAGIGWLRLLHGRSFHIRAIKNAIGPDNQLRNPFKPGECKQRARLACRRRTREPAHAESRDPCIAPNPSMFAINDDFDAPQGIGLQKFCSHAGIIVPAEGDVASADVIRPLDSTRNSPAGGRLPEFADIPAPRNEAGRFINARDDGAEDPVDTAFRNRSGSGPDHRVNEVLSGFKEYAGVCAIRNRPG
jgi:hypothetical protein